MIEEQLFHQALEQPEDQRASFLDAACKGDADLRERVQVLLRAHANPGSFLEFPPRGAAPTIDHPPLEQPGAQIGPYKLLEQIGEGGMGVVYHASQREPIRRTVALKIIKPGMDTREVVARFEAERQALALMDHPNIAKVFDAGATAAGRPYFAMELVQGTPITEYCDRQQLSTRERLELFVTLCHGVQHAHQKGVIHRDLKPSNLLVEVHDVRPVPKIIDFGIAKAMGQKLTEHSLHTALEQMVGTPLYMSPEQAGQCCKDVDTRSDIYSLGVVLYELLTGSTPFEKDALRTAGVDEMRRIIREVEPPRPSARISTLQAADLSTISERRHIEPRKLSQQLRGDLDWIVMKAMDKDRDRRYESVSALASDVQRYLDNEPVQARPPTLADRAAKWARRRRGLVVACAAILLIVSIISVVSAVLILQAWGEVVRQRNVAEENQHKAEAQRQRAVLNLQRSVANLGKSLNIIHSLASQGNTQQAMIMLGQLIDNSSSDPGVRMQTGMAYVHLALLYTSQGQDAQSIAAWKRCVAALEGLVKEFPEDSIYLQELGNAQHIQGRCLYANNEHTLARVQFSRASDNYRLAMHLSEDAETLNFGAWFLATCPDLDFRDAHLAVVAAEKAVQLTPDSGKTWNTLGVAYYRAEEWPEAIAALETSISLCQINNTYSWFFLAMAHWHLGNKDEAYRWYDMAVAWMDKNRFDTDYLQPFCAEASQLLGTPEPAKAEEKPQ